MAYLYPMKEMTIVYFCKKENCAGRLKRRGEWQYYVEKDIVTTPGGDLALYTVQIPAFFRKKKSWQDKMLHAYLGGLAVPNQEKYVLYVYEKQAAELLHTETAPLSEEWLFFLLRYYEPCFANLIILDSGKFRPKVIAHKYVRYVHYLGFATIEEEAGMELCEELSEEYGILPEMADSVKGLHPMPGSRLIVAADNLYGVSPAWLNTETVWLSAVVSSVAKRICARARDAIYIDIEVFLEDVLRP